MRVIVSMTSTPARNGTRHHTLDSLVHQTRVPDSIRVYGSEDIFTTDEFLPYVKLLDLTETEDRGPVTKLSVLEDQDITDDDLIVTVDDDIVYQPRWLETLVAGAEAHPDEAVGFSGWNAYGFIEAERNGWREGGDYIWAEVPGPCDVLEGWSGIAYRKKFFWIDPVMGTASVLNPLPDFKLVDDVWIAYHLHRRGIGRATIHHRMSMERPDNLPGLHNRADFKAINRRAALIAFGPAIKR
jgi:hypothetical protein